MTDLRKLMINAHKEAKRTVEAVGDYMIALKLAMKKEWAEMAYQSEAEKLQEMTGWNRWTKYGKDRVYFDLVVSGLLDIDYYKSGNISSAAFNGEGVSNAEAYRLKGVKVYVDVEDGKVSKPHYSYNSDLEGSEELDTITDTVNRDLAKLA